MSESPNIEAKAQALKDLISQFSGGSDGRYRHWANKRFIYTAGVKAVAEALGAYWLLDIVATEVAPLCLQQWEEAELGMSMLEVNVAKSSADLALTFRDDAPPAWSRHIEFTDFPEGKWTFELSMDGLLDPEREVLVMLLLSEH